MTLYHGATVRVEHPLCDFGRPDLDFGRGFYLTNLKEQAEEWAARQADSRKEPGVLNVYEFDRESAIKEYRYLLFPAYDRNWLHFIVDSRNGPRRMLPGVPPADAPLLFLQKQQFFFYKS